MRRAGGVAPRRLAGRTQEDRLQSGYTPSAAVFSDGNLLPDDLADDVRERLAPRRPSALISALSWPKPAMPEAGDILCCDPRPLSPPQHSPQGWPGAMRCSGMRVHHCSLAAP